MTLYPYSESWPALFDTEAALIRDALASWLNDPLADVQHIGSTSIPGLEAKPTIDMLAGIRSISDLGACIEVLARLNYQRRPELETRDDRRYCFKWTPTGLSYAIHVIQRHDPLWKRFIIFRDTLRSNASLRDDYANLKRHCAGEFNGDVRTYTRAKDPFIRGVVELAACSPS